MKKILSLVLAVMLLLQINLLPVQAASKNTDFEKTLLSVLDIVPKSKAATSGLSRYELAEIVSKIILYKNNIALGTGETMYVDIPHTAEAAVVINTVTSRGIMSGVGEGRFDPDSSVTLNQAVCTIVNLLGYKNAALAEGGFPDGYFKIASDIGILKNVNLAEETITYANLRTLLANALATDVMIMTGVGENQKYEILKDEPLLTYEMGLKKVEGVVRGTLLSAITEEAFTGRGEVNINGNIYGIGDFNANEYVGYYVNACFIDEDDSDYQEIIYIEKVNNKNETLEIYSDEFHSWTGDEIVYVRNGESKRAKAKLADGADVMYNGTPLATYDEDDFELSNGIITLIDNTGDGRYDIISLTEYRTVAVKNINVSKKTILDLFSADNSLDMHNADDENITILDAKGDELSLGEITAGDVVTWYVDRTGENYTLIVATDAGIAGSVTGKDLELGLLYIDDEEYKMSPEYISRYEEEMAENLELENGKDELAYGKSGTFYLDYLERVVGFKSGEGVLDEWIYGWIVKPVYDEDNDSYLLKIHTEDNIEQFYTVAENFRVDFVRIKDDFRENVIMNLSPGLIKFTINAADEIIKIDTLAKDTEEDSLTEIFNGSEAWKGMGTNSFNGKLIAD